MRIWVALGVAGVLALAGCGNDSSPSGGAGGSAGSGGSGGAGAMGGNGGAGDCTSNAACDTAEYCAGDACDGPGTCESRPLTCTDEVDPVCGCDGETYGNPCEASQAGVRIASEGECPCFDNDDCLVTEYCDQGEVCAGGGGTCEERPTPCPLVFDPVCGCDGETYGNACLANAAGVQVSADQECGCDTNDDCDPTELCDADTCDGPGYCAMRPDLCLGEPDDSEACDGMDYLNACTTLRAGVRVVPDLDE